MTEKRSRRRKAREWWVIIRGSFNDGTSPLYDWAGREPIRDWQNTENREVVHVREVLPKKVNRWGVPMIRGAKKVKRGKR